MPNPLCQATLQRFSSLQYGVPFPFIKSRAVLPKCSNAFSASMPRHWPMELQGNDVGKHGTFLGQEYTGVLPVNPIRNPSTNYQPCTWRSPARAKASIISCGSKTGTSMGAGADEPGASAGSKSRGMSCYYSWWFNSNISILVLKTKVAK